MFAPSLLLALAATSPPPLCDGPCDLTELEAQLEDPTALDRADILDARDALLTDTRARSIVLSFELDAWRRGGDGREATGTSWLLTLALRPEAWLTPVPERASRRSAPPRHAGHACTDGAP